MLTFKQGGLCSILMSTPIYSVLYYIANITFMRPNSANVFIASFFVKACWISYICLNGRLACFIFSCLLPLSGEAGCNAKVRFFGVMNDA